VAAKPVAGRAARPVGIDETKRHRDVPDVCLAEFVDGRLVHLPLCCRGFEDHAGREPSREPRPSAIVTRRRGSSFVVRRVRRLALTSDCALLKARCLHHERQGCER
jgi:hypothetical protein